MTITAGDRIPDAELRTMTPDGPTAVRSTDLLGTGRVVLFAVPGAFTPGCPNVAHGVGDGILMLADGNAEGTTAIQLLDGSTPDASASCTPRR